jgi:molybdenum cofactor biosynthesis enzyme MoaA
MNAVEIWFEIEPDCNLACRFCYNWWRGGTVPAPRRLDTAAVIDVLENLFASLTCSKVALSGGEPLLRQDLAEIVMYIHGRGVPCIITTNGTLLTSGSARQLTEAGVSTWQVPLHSTHAPTHDLLSGVRCWEETIRGLVLLRDAGAQIVPVFVATRVNLDHFSEVLKLHSLLGIEHVIFNRFVPAGLGAVNAGELGVPEDREILAYLESAHPLAASLGISIHTGVPVSAQNSSLAGADGITWTSCPVERGQTRWTIGCDGSVRRCNDSQVPVANMLQGGARIVAAEVDSFSRNSVGPTRGCHFLKNHDLVAIAPAAR